SSAGQLRLVTKSGTQSFRGNVFWSGQNDALDTNTWSHEQAGLPKSPHNYNAWGFTLGGPLYIPGAFNTSKQKLFFFWGEEWQRDRFVEEQIGIVPTAAMRNGDFSALLPGRVIRDPLTGLPFAGNIIPSSRFSAQGRALLNSFPLPIPGFAQGANNWIGNPPTFNNQRKDSIKIDYVASSKHRVAVRHTWAPNYWNDPEHFAVYATIWDYPGRTLAATFTSTLSNTLMNEASFSWGTTSPSKYFGQRNCDYCPGGTTAFLYPTQADVGLNYQYLFPGTKLDPDKIPNISLHGLFDDYTEFGNKPDTPWLAMAYDVYAQDSWKPARNLTLELGLRYLLWQPWGVNNGAMASFDNRFYTPATAPVIDRAGGFIVSGDRFDGIVLPGDGPSAEALATFPGLANLQRLYHGL